MIHYPTSTHDPHSHAKCIKYDTLYETGTNVPHNVSSHPLLIEPCRLGVMSCVDEE
jgi:hypothetical protein